MRTAAIAMTLSVAGLAISAEVERAASVPALGADSSDRPVEYTELVHHCEPLDATGLLTGSLVPIEIRINPTEDLSPVVGVEQIRPLPGQVGGQFPAGGAGRMPFNPNRIDVVFVGDGYLSSELGTYATQVDGFADDMFRYEPYTSYRPLFQIHRVDVVSNESGVDNDPTLGVDRDTALDMRYWCNDIERLLCVSVSKAQAFANTAPDVDLVIALANSSKYGGAGYSSSDLGTLTAGNPLAADIVIHEAGHALGNLADEYDYGGPSTYVGGEPGESNVSTFDATEMLQREQKWHRWLGEDFGPFDGPIGTYEGARYSQFEIYRPSDNGMMRSLNRPFNLQNAEATIIEFYQLVDVIDTHTPNDQPVAGCETLVVEHVEPLTGSVQVDWFANSVQVASNTDAIDLCGVGLAPGPYRIEAIVTDNTDWVRDEIARRDHMQQTIAWTVLVPQACLADLSSPADPGVPDGVLTGADFFEFLSRFQAGDLSVDFSSPTAPGVADGVLTGADFFEFLDLFSQGCN